MAIFNIIFVILCSYTAIPANEEVKVCVTAVDSLELFYVQLEDSQSR